MSTYEANAKSKYGATVSHGQATKLANQKPCTSCCNLSRVSLFLTTHDTTINMMFKVWYVITAIMSFSMPTLMNTTMPILEDSTLFP